MDMTFDTVSVSVEVQNNKEVVVDAIGIDSQTVLGNFTTEDVVEHFDTYELLGEIGEQAIREWAIENGLIDEE
jgi:hypothetical protein